MVPFSCRNQRTNQLFGAVAVLLLFLWIVAEFVEAQETTGLRGDRDAIADAEAMVETMGGMAI